MGILDWLRGLGGAGGGKEDAQAGEALERVVQLANPRLALAHRYKSRLTPAVRDAMDYAHQLVTAIAPAREANKVAWQADPNIRSIFATAQDVARTFSRSPDVQSWFMAYPAEREVCAVVSMQLLERRVLGTALVEGVLQREVPQTTVSFTDFRIRICAATEAELREDLERRIVDQLALSAIASAAREESRREGLEQERALLRARLRLLERRGAGMSGLGTQAPAESADRDRIQRDLALNEQNLRALAVGPGHLEQQLEQLRGVLSDPASHFSVTTRRIHVDNMNIIVPQDSSAPGATLDLQVAKVPVRDGAPELRTFIFARFPRAELLRREDIQSESARLLR